MNNESIFKISFDEIFKKYSIQGYVTSNYIYDILEKNDFTLTDTEYFCENLINKGILILSNENIDDYSNDYSFYDYEKIYNKILKIDKSLEYIIDYIRLIKPPQRNEFDTLFIQSKNGNEYARDRIIKMNMRLAVRHALYFNRKYKYPLDIAIQESFCGLIKAINTYTFEKGKYQNYVQWMIRHALIKSLPTNNNLIICPQHIRNDYINILKYFKFKSGFYIYKHKLLIKRKIKKILDCNKKKCNILYLCLQKPLSFEYLLEKNNILFSDKENLINDLNDNITNQYLHNTILNLLSTLRGKEAEILIFRYGMGITKSHTLDEIGEKYNLTRERIRQIENKAIRRFSNPKRSRILLKYFEYNVEEPSDEGLPKNMKFLK